MIDRKPPVSPSRRKFVETAAKAGVAAAAFSVSPLGSWKAWAQTVEQGAAYDFIIVGSGAAGGTLASRLVQRNFRVLLIEAGKGNQEKRFKIPFLKPDGKTLQNPVFDPRQPVAHGFASDDPNLAWGFYVNHYKEAGADGKKSAYLDSMNQFYRRSEYGDPARTGIYYPRGSTVGGSTAVNAMITLYPDAQDWEEMGQIAQDPKYWSQERLSKIFARLDHACSPFSKNSEANSRAEWEKEVLHWTRPWLRNEGVNPTLAGFDTVTARVVFAAVAGCYLAGGTLRADMREFLREFADSTGKLAFDDNKLQMAKERFLQLLRRIQPNKARYIADKTEGLLDLPKATLQGKRFGTRDLIEKTLEQFGPRGSVKAGLFTLMDGTLVTRVAIDKTKAKPTAVGVHVIQSRGIYGATIAGVEKDPVGAEKFIPLAPGGEVILSGGAFNSPQLLMLSGIGPESEIAKIPSERRLEPLPGVGKNLQDRYEVTVTLELSRELQALARCKIGQEPDQCLTEWSNDPAKSLYSSNGALAAVTTRSSVATKNKTTPDLMVFALGGNFPGYLPNYSHSAINSSMVSWAILKGHTNNTAGEVTLRSDDAKATPKINFNYFDEGSPGWEDDLQAVVDGVRLVQDRLATPLVILPTKLRPSQLTEHMRKYGPKGWREVLPTGAFDPAVKNTETEPNAKLKDFVRKNAWGHHASCTCKMGPNPKAGDVVDSRFRVHGVQGLRVADASVFPKIPGLFIAVPTYLIGEQAASIVGEDHGFADPMDKLAPHS